MGGPSKDSALWPRSAGGAGGGWGNDGPDNQMGGYGNPSSSGWGDIEPKRDPSGIWPDNGSGWGARPPRNPVGPNNGGGIRSSPGWGPPGGDDSTLDTGNSGWPVKPVGPAMRTPGGGGDMGAPGMMWQQSKPYRKLIELGYTKSDVETALRNGDGSLEDALQLLTNAGRMPAINKPDPMGFGGPSDSGSLYDRGGSRGFGPGSSNQMYGGPQDPQGMMGNPGNFGNPANPMMQKIPMNPGSSSNLPPTSVPPISSTRPQQPTSQPSAQQLRMLVQQIQMAVQAGHLNPQILNQPLAPQTLILLNQLLQQIKTLQTLQQNHTMAQANKSMTNSRELLSISVNITKTKQHITNLQNQISAQQANYLKSQNMPQQGLTGSMPPGPLQSNTSGMGGLGGSDHSSDIGNIFNELTISNSGNNLSDGVGGSRLSQWKLGNSDSFSIGKYKQFCFKVRVLSSFHSLCFFLNVGNKGSSSGKLGFGGGDDTWALSSNSANSGWPDSKQGQSSSTVGVPSSASGLGGSNSDALNGIDTFGIPEFEPGKPWKGPGMKNPDEDPNLTPGSVAPTAIDLIKSNSSSNMTNTSGSGLVENTLGLTSPTWSFNNPTSTENKMKDSWNNGGITTSTLTPMGQDLWGKSGRTPPGLGGWPSTSASSNGWSSGQNGANGNLSDMPTWLLLKNLTPQIDGATLKTLCIQHGPLNKFHLFLNNGIALVMYNSGREAAKAQKALNNCLLNNTTIQANITNEAEANNIMQQLGGGNSINSSQSSTISRGATPSSSKSNDMWGNSMAPTSIFGSGGGSSVWGAPTVSTGADEGQRNTPQLQPYLPGDLLGESTM